MTDVTVPDLCFAPCNDAYKEAQQVGKNRDLCLQDSPFVEALRQCFRCVEENPQTQNESTVRDTYLDQEFFQFVDYCDFELDSFGLNYVTDVFTVPGGHVTTLVYLDAANTRDGGSSITSTSATSTTSSSGRAPGETNANPTGTNVEDGGEGDDSSQAWLAGPIVGGIAGLLLILGAIFFLYRRRRRAKTRSGELEGNFEKPMLHGDCVPLPEKHLVELSPEQIYEMDAGMAPELNGQARHEMETVEREQELQGDAAYNIKRKPVASYRHYNDSSKDR